MDYCSVILNISWFYSSKSFALSLFLCLFAILLYVHMSFYNVMFYMLACFYLYVCISSAMTKIKVINHITRPKLNTEHTTDTIPLLRFRFVLNRKKIIDNWLISMINDHSRTDTIMSENIHDDVIKWKHSPRYWPFARGIHRSPVNYPHKGQWREALMFPLICAWTNNDWVNNRDAGDFRRHRAHYDVTIMLKTLTETLRQNLRVFCTSPSIPKETPVLAPPRMSYVFIPW